MSSDSTLKRGLGINAGLDATLASELAASCQELGYHSLWSNDEPEASGLETLAALAAGAPSLELGVGVLPLDRHPPARIAGEIGRLSLDATKLWVGIGSGQIRSPAAVVKRSVLELRELLPEKTRIVVAAMRPELCRLGGAIADGVLLNWMLPAQAVQAGQWVHDGAEEVGRQRPIVASYVRVAVGSDAGEGLRKAENIYRNISSSYRRHFEAMHAPLGTVGVVGSDRASVLGGLAPYSEALDLTIVRVIAARDLDSLNAVAVAAAP